MTSIAIVGTGRMGGAFAARLVDLGHSVVMGSREPARTDLPAQVAELGGNVAVASIAEAAEQADQIVIAVPYAAFSAVLPEMGELSGKLVIDASNALGMGQGGLMELVSDTSAGEELQAAKPDANVVKAFNTIGFHIVANPAAAGGPVSTMLAGNDAEAKSTVADFARSLGFEVTDVGPLKHARYLEGMSALYLVPYLQGRIGDAFEFYLRTGSSPAESKGVRAAG